MADLQRVLLWMLLVRNVASLSQKRICVVGGGASGMFAAIAAASQEPNVSVTVLEASSKILQKVKISGGGRCNVMHDSEKSVNWMLQTAYPRGSKELKGLLHKHFTPSDCKDWFESHGVQLKTEDDGRMFPVTDSSQTVIDALMKAADSVSVDVRTRCPVHEIAVADNGTFQVSLKDKEAGTSDVEHFHALVLATGSVPAGYRLATSLGHVIDSTAPSLFTLSTSEAIQQGNVLNSLAGLSVPQARISYEPPTSTDESMPSERRRNKKRKLITQEGPMLVTHHGLSGPAALRLSAFAAREMAAFKYTGSLHVQFAVDWNVDDIAKELLAAGLRQPQKHVATVCPLLSLKMPRRLWASIVQMAGIPSEMLWSALPKKSYRKLATLLVDCPLQMTGKGTFKEEFVTCGGVNLREIDMTTMQSKKQAGLFLCGEVIDVDGVTGGFNFMNAWGTGYVAGCASAEYIGSMES